MVSLINSHSDAASRRYHLCEIDFRFAFKLPRFAPGLPQGWFEGGAPSSSSRPRASARAAQGGHGGGRFSPISSHVPIPANIQGISASKKCRATPPPIAATTCAYPHRVSFFYEYGLWTRLPRVITSGVIRVVFGCIKRYSAVPLAPETAKRLFGYLGRGGLGFDGGGLVIFFVFVARGVLLSV